MSSNHTIVCTNDCGIVIENDPGASGSKCPKCKNGALVAEESEMAP